jgi:TetR/AcrR family acrAB operon transcriptional repressor
MSFTFGTQGHEQEPAGAQARSRADTRRRLVSAATELFAREGLHRTTSTRIARGAGVAAGTFYLHFRDKHDLFRAIAFDALGQLRARLAQAAERAGADPRIQLRARMDQLVAFAEEQRDLVRILFGRGHEAAALGDDLIDELFPGVEARLRERIADGLADPGLHAAVAAQSLLAMWTRVVAWWVEDPRRAPREAVVETLVRLHPIHRFEARSD